MRAEPLEPRRIRRPQGAYGWVDLRVVTDGHLKALGCEAALTYLFLCAVGNAHGVSFWGRDRMSAILGLPIPVIAAAFDKLVTHDLIAVQGRIVQVLPLEDRGAIPSRSPQAPKPSPAPVAEAIDLDDTPIDEDTFRTFESEARSQLAKLGSRVPHESSVRALARSLARQERRSRHG